jgi:hypothetical protein
MKRGILSRRTAGLALLPAALLLSSCIHAFWQTVAIPITRPDTGSVYVKTPIKAHLVDGRTVVFRRGATIDRRSIAGPGMSYGITATAYQGTPLDRVSLDSVVGVETFEGKLLQTQTFVVSTAATVLTAAATVTLLKVLFGSCPTVYADTGTGPMLQAEGFSYAIAPLLEQRDVDPLVARPDSDGIIRLELRNEALETHNINAIELTAARHARGERVMPDQDNNAVAVANPRAFDAVRDRAGRDVGPMLAAADGALFSSDARTVDAAHTGDLDDWIDLDARGLPPGDSIAVVLRMRNSLLNTVLLYDGMLSGRDSPDWLDTKLQHIATAIDLSKWYTRTMGLRVSVGTIGSSEASWTGRVGDVGPLAFRDFALVVPRPSRNARSLRVRLRFVADDWRIDYAALSAHVSRPVTSTIPLRRVMAPTQPGQAATTADTAALAALRDADGRYLQTLPGQRMILEFDAGRNARRSDSTTTYLIVWQGWYREWIRGQWLAEPQRTTAWTPGDSTVLAAMHRWRAHQSEMERAFYSTRVPVR